MLRTAWEREFGDVSAADDTAHLVHLSDLLIQTKDQQLVPLVPNAVQESFLDDVAPGWRHHDYAIRNVRKIILKARQFGFSTIIIALYFLATVNGHDVNTVIMADDADNTEELFQKVHIFWQNLPEGKQPKTRYNNRKQLYFPHSRSRISVLTAGKKTGGRSRTIHNLHGSEVPFWPYPELLTGLLQAVPKGGNVILESTANGEDEVFCPEYRKAAKGESPYGALFVPWWEHPEYETEPPEGFTRGEDDEKVAIKYDLDAKFGTDRANAKLYWRRLKWDEPGMGNLFAQEYPGDAKEAFRVSGKTFFTEWDEDRHIVEPFEVPKWWKRVGGYDWGYGKPFCYLHGAIDGNGGITLFGEAYGARLLNHEQVALVQQVHAEDGVQSDEVEIYADPSMWNVKKDKQGVGYRDVDDFFDAGLWMIKANNTRTGGGGHGWSNMRRYLHDTITDPQTGEQYPALRVMRGKCPNFCRTTPLMVHSETNPEDMDSEKEDHPDDAGRYLTNSHLRPVKDPNAPKPKEPDRWQKMDEQFRKRTRKYDI